MKSEINTQVETSRLREERERLGYTVSGFAEKMGTTRQTQAKYEKLLRKPDTEYLYNASKLGVDIYYVITGARHLFKNQSENTNNNGESILNEFTSIPPLDSKLSDMDEGGGTSTPIIFRKEWISSELRSSISDLSLIYADDSMEPSLCREDIVLIDHGESIAARDGIYAIKMGQSILIKRLQHLPNQRLKVSSDNPNYESFEISLNEDHDDEFVIIGRVVWSGHRY